MYRRNICWGISLGLGDLADFNYGERGSGAGPRQRDPSGISVTCLIYAVILLILLSLMIIPFSFGSEGIRDESRLWLLWRVNSGLSSLPPGSTRGRIWIWRRSEVSWPETPGACGVGGSDFGGNSDDFLSDQSGSDEKKRILIEERRESDEDCSARSGLRREWMWIFPC